MTLRIILAALVSLCHHSEDRNAMLEKQAQMTGIAAAVATERLTPDERAFLIAWGDAETHYSLRIHSGRCKRFECDRGRARGPWQVHRSADMTQATWDAMHGIEGTAVQVREAARKVRWALRQCPDDRVRGGFRVLGGRGCLQPIRGEAERVETYRKVRARL